LPRRQLRAVDDDRFAWPHHDGLKWPHLVMVDVLAG
jgi:hypothetical protein